MSDGTLVPPPGGTNPMDYRFIIAASVSRRSLQKARERSASALLRSFRWESATWLCLGRPHGPCLRLMWPVFFCVEAVWGPAPCERPDPGVWGINHEKSLLGV